MPSQTDESTRKGSDERQPTPGWVLSQAMFKNWGKGNLVKRVDDRGEVIDWCLWDDNFGWRQVLIAEMRDEIGRSDTKHTANLPKLIKEVEASFKSHTPKTKLDDWDKNTSWVQVADCRKGFKIEPGLKSNQLPKPVDIPKDERILIRWPGEYGEWVVKNEGRGLDKLAPEWQKYLGGMLDAETIARMEAVIGQALFGNYAKSILFVVGQADSGKTAFLNILNDLLGDMMTSININALMVKSKDQRNVGLEPLKRALIAKTDEIQSGKSPLNQSLIKSISGGDGIPFRPHYGYEATIPGARLLVLSGNKLPEIQSVERAIEIRSEFIPFKKSIPPSEQVSKSSIFARLQPEQAQILARLVIRAINYFNDKTLPQSKEMEVVKRDWLETEIDLILEAVRDDNPKIWSKKFNDNGFVEPILLAQLANNLKKARVCDWNGKQLGPVLEANGFIVRPGRQNKRFVHLPTPVDEAVNEAVNEKMGSSLVRG